MQAADEHWCLLSLTIKKFEFFRRSTFPIPARRKPVMVSSSPITARKEPSAGAPPAAMSAVLGHVLVLTLRRSQTEAPSRVYAQQAAGLSV